MSLKQTLLITAICISFQVCFGQSLDFGSDMDLNKMPTGEKAPFIILKVNDKALEFDASKNEPLDLKLINPNTIQSICVFEPPIAMQNHGDKRKNGAVVISFKEYSLLSEELKSLFDSKGKQSNTGCK